MIGTLYRISAISSSNKTALEYLEDGVDTVLSVFLADGSENWLELDSK